MINLLTNIKPRFNNVKSPKNYYLTPKIADDIVDNQSQIEDKKNKHTGMIILSSAVLATGLALLFTKALPKSLYKKIENHLRTIAQNNPANKDKINEKLNKLIKRSQSINNFTSIKDILFKKIMQLNKVLAKIHIKTTEFFEKLACTTVRRKYITASEKFEKFSEFSKDFEVKDTKGLLDELSSIYHKNFSLKSQDKRRLKIRKACEGLDIKVLEQSRNGIGTANTFNQNINNLKVSQVHQIFIAENILSPEKAKILSEIQTPKELMIQKVKELLKIQKTSVNEKSYRQLERKANRFIRSINKATKIESEEFFDKERDLSLGSAPTDVLNILSSMVGVGIGLSKAKNKDERVSATLKYGIPVVGGIAVSLVTTLSLVSGFKGMAIGLLSGFALSKLGTSIDKLRKKDNKKNLDIAFIDNVKSKIHKSEIEKPEPKNS